MCINKETNNSIIEVFSGDTLQFGQGYKSYSYITPWSELRFQITYQQEIKVAWIEY